MNESLRSAESPWYAHAMEQLIEVVQQLSLARDLETVMQIVRHAARRLTGADGATFVLRDGDKCFYADEDAISPLWKGQRFPMSACISGWVMLNRQPALIGDIYADPRIPADAYRPTFVKSLAMVPIRTLDPIGAIGNYWAELHRPAPEQVRVLQALADTTAVAMENVRIYAELEQRVQQRTSELQAILDNVQVGVVFVVAGRIVRANPKSAEMFRIAAPEAMLNMPLQNLLGENDVESARKRLAEGRVCDFEAKIDRHDRSGFWSRLVAKPIDSSSEIWVIEDISEVKAKERALVELRMTAEEATRFKSEFLASMSHELRTPLNAIIGFSEVLRDGLAGELREKQREYISDIFESGQHLLSLINDVLDLSKIEAGRMTMEGEETDIAALLHGSLSVIKEKAMAHRIRLNIDAPASLGEIRVDPRKCKQIVYNLLSNAVKFTPEGGEVFLRGSVVEREEAEERARMQAQVHPAFSCVNAEKLLEISVSDTGIGISAQDMARLFRPFVQIDSSLSRQFEGTGLGLALVRKLAELHGGAVALQSVPGKGSTFTVWLPYRSFPEDEMKENRNFRPVDEANPLVLVVEDNDRAADLIRLQLEKNRCRVVRAASAEKSLEILEEAVPDLVTLDVLLPGMDGWELLSRLRASEKYAHIPVVIVSIVADGRNGLSLGASEVLQKPVTMLDMTEALSRLGISPAKAAGESATVLVIDDDPNAVEIAASFLDHAGYGVVRAHGGEEGLAKALSILPDLIVLDLLMPEVSGFDVVERLKQEWKTAAVPILVLTSKVLTDEDRRLLDGHVQKIMEKSRFDHGNFISEVRRALGRKWERGIWQES